MSGRNQIRVALGYRRGSLKEISEDTGCGIEALAAFTRGEVSLSAPVLRALAQRLFRGDYDVAADRVMLTGGPPQPPEAA